VKLNDKFKVSMNISMKLNKFKYGFMKRETGKVKLKHVSLIIIEK